MSLLLDDLKTAYLGKVARRRNGHIEIADATYRHRCGHQIRLIGAMHIASRSSWDALDVTLREGLANGWAVHLEGVGKISDDASPELVAIANDLNAIMKRGYQILGKDVGLSMQWDEVEAPAGANKIDVNIADVVAQLDPTRIRKIRDLLQDAKPSPIAKATDETAGAITDVIRQSMALFFCAPTILTGVLPKIMPNHVVLDQRNIYATTRAMQEERDVIMFWGAAHLPGMSRILYRNGYRITQHQWRPAVRLADIKVKPANTAS